MHAAHTQKTTILAKKPPKTHQAQTKSKKVIHILSTFYTHFIHNEKKHFSTFKNFYPHYNSIDEVKAHNKKNRINAAKN